MTRDQVQDILHRKLADLKPTENPGNIFSYETVGSNLRGDPLPAPYMVYIILAELLEFPSAWMPFEKTLWSIPVTYKDTELLLEHGKFGLRVSSKKGQELKVQLLPELYKLLRESFSVADRYFSIVVEEKLRSGAVTIPNHFHQLTGRYFYLRELAQQAFGSEPPPAEVLRTDEAGQPIATCRDILKPQREGYYLAAAAMDAYFSRLEHLLILAYPFVSYQPGADVLEFIKLQWADKYTAIFDFEKEPAANRTYDQLVAVKRNYRNPLAHGGLDRAGGNLFIHYGRLGAIPARLSTYGSGIFPISQMAFEDVCETFDKADEFFSSGSIAAAWKYVDAGFDVAFDANSIGRFKTYLDMDADELHVEIERLAYEFDRYANMEW